MRILRWQHRAPEAALPLQKPLAFPLEGDRRVPPFAGASDGQAVFGGRDLLRDRESPNESDLS
jgi:hypothetical protein